MSTINISSLKEQAGEIPLIASVSAQLQSRSNRTTKDGKPYCDLVFADSTGNISLKIWSNNPLHETAANLPLKSVLKLDGEWTQNQYGVNANNLTWSILDDDAAIADFMAGDPILRRKQETDFQYITTTCAQLTDPRLLKLCSHFLETMGDRFRRTAAARKNHHARRGGLVEHVAQMMRSANAICNVYPELHRDIIITAVLFHDSGKLWENTYPEEGFNQLHTLHGEMLGHIPLGIELVNKLWREIPDSSEFTNTAQATPPAEDLRLHLLHLIGSHHGQFDYGSPVLPRTAEAYALHYIDNLDAKLEMVRDAYTNATEIAPGIYDRVFPLASSLVRPLPPFQPAPPEQSAPHDQAPENN